MKRPLCLACNQRHAGVNYKRNGKIYYRRKCDTCIREGRGIKPAKPNWSRDGYKKKMFCDKCGFKARWARQIVVYYVDGDLNNTKQTNLKSICLNCSIAVEKQDMPWTRGLDISPDN